MKPASELAIYTTIYPGVEQYVADWYQSLCQQTDQEYQLWIGLDTLDGNAVERVLGSRVDAHWVETPRGSTPAKIRDFALSRIVKDCAAVVLVDSDDVLFPSRVAAARRQLERCDLGGCALRLIDFDGRDLRQTFNLPEEVTPDEVFPRCNVFGFSNSIYRAELLRRCLPIPDEATLVDWFLSTRAWLLGANFDFDREPRMSYRQHSSNTAHVRLPFRKEQVFAHTELVRRHFKLVLATPSNDFVGERYTELARAHDDVAKFWSEIVCEPKKLESYVEALNQAVSLPIWWTSVAFPALGHMWRPRGACS